MARLRMPRPIPTLEGERVTLRPPDPAADAHDYFEMNLDPDMHTWTGNRVLASRAEAHAELERFAAMDDVSTWMIVDRASARVMGRFFLYVESRDGVRVAGEGNRVARPYWRKGHNREARALLLPYVFGDLCADLLETRTWAENVNSVRSIEAHGFRLEREVLEWSEKHGRELLARYYTLTEKQAQTAWPSLHWHSPRTGA